MTMLYRLDAHARTIAQCFGARAGDDPWAGGHVSPGQFAPVITAGREEIAGPRRERQPRRMIPRLWGVPPLPSMHGAPRGIANVRNVDSPFWTGNLRNSEFRCLIPATAFMEWHKGVDAQGKRIQRWYAPADQELFAMAGVWKDSEIPTFALVTCGPNALLREAGRDAMPVILPADPKAQDLWLRGDWNRARELLVPYASSMMGELSPKNGRSNLPR
jgi:putative SOS response-associated peptidase YedK